MTKDRQNLESTNPSKTSKEHLASKDKITFDDFDQLNLKSFGETIVKIIENDKTLSNDQKSCTISLNAGFGQGKTIFLEMLKDFIEKEKGDKYTVLFIDAWKGDFFKEPIITILSEFLEYLEKTTQNNTTVKSKIFEILGSIVIKGTLQWGQNFTNQWLKNMGVNTDINMKEIKKVFENLSKDKEVIGESLFKEFEQRKGVLKEIKNIISDYTQDGKKLVIIVDELDRARPDYAVHFLEDMKHFFDIENVVFIFGVNKKQMEATVKTLYGNDLKFEGYYRKFFKHERDLPDPYKEAINFIKSLLKQTKTDEKLNSAANIHFLFKAFKLTLRDLSRFIELCDIVLAKTTVDDERNYKYSNSVLFFILLYLKKQDVFNKVLNNEFNLDDFFKFIDEAGEANEAKISYNSDEEKDFLTQVAFSFLLKSPYQRSDFISIGTEPKQQIENFESGVKKIEAKFGKYSVSSVFSFLFNIHKPPSYIIRKEPCLIICDAIQHRQPFYTNKSGFQ